MGRLQAFELLAGWKAGTFLGYARQFAVAEDAGFWVLSGERLEQFVHRVLLDFCTRVGSLASLIEASFVDDTQGTVVVVAGMYTLDGLWQ
jgi:hypothetical protein